ncbi:MAG: GH116 family glycosyl hydrolase [Chitinispirillaceae bacterium]
MSRRISRLLSVVVSMTVLTGGTWAASELPQVDGTTGAPLGGFGTGAVKFCGNNGKLFFADVAPIYCANGTTGFVGLPANFAFYSNRGGTIATSTRLVAASTKGRYNDDAIYPIQKANFGTINGITVSLVGSCPWTLSDTNKLNYPCALFEFVLTNTLATPVDAAVGFKLTTGNTPVLASGKGFRDETANAHQKAIYAKSSDPADTITVGSDANFLSSGKCSNSISGTTNMVAVKTTLPANTTKYVKFVLAWYNATNTSFYNYTNLFSAAGAVADSGLAGFDVFLNNAVTFVTRMRSSNVPDWIVNTTLNSLINLTNNSGFMKDKRTYYSEGHWSGMGTSDQMWMARQAVAQLCPYFAWKELEFWARTQKIDATGLGQIHHDIGTCTTIATWDQTTWVDYRDINPWVDLNCGFIVSVYETFMATGNKTKLDYFWPYVLKAGQRILKQVTLYGNKTYPYTFDTAALSSYDWNGSGATHLYNSSFSIAAYKVMSKLANVENDTATASLFSRARDTAVANFKKRFIDNIFPTAHYCEAIGTGPWLCDFLKLGQDFDTTGINKVLNQLNTFYSPLTQGCGKNEGPDFGGNYYIWMPHLLLHYADLSLIAKRPDIWYAIRHDQFQRDYLDRNRVFDVFLGTYLTPTPLDSVATDSTGWDNYISNPCIFRDYYSIIGYQRNQYSGELWLEPNLPASMNDTMKNAFYASPEGNGTISFTLNPVNFEQRLVFTPDNTIPINQIYIKDLYGDSVPPVWVNHAAIAKANVTRIGMGFGKELKINWTGTAGPGGLIVEVANTSTAVLSPMATGKELSAVVARAGRQLVIRYSLGRRCSVSVRLFHINGEKIADLIVGMQNEGVHEVTWSGHAAAPAACIVEIKAGDLKVVRKVTLMGR